MSEVLGKVIRLQATANLRQVDFGKVEPGFAGVGPSVDFVEGRRGKIEVLDEALAHEVDGFRFVEALRPEESRLLNRILNTSQMFQHFCNDARMIE